MDKAPIVLFVYNRLEHTRKTVEALRNNEFASDSVLFIISDGPKTKEDDFSVNQVRKYIQTINGFQTVHVIKRKRNYGLARNIIAGVTTIVNQYGKIIVLEDDIVTSKFFLRYMNEALIKYEHISEVMSVSGYLAPMDKSGLPVTFFMPWFECWGWGTWKRSWDLFNRNPEYLLKKTVIREIDYINVFGSDPSLWNQVIDNYRNKIKTWAIFFHVCICENSGLVLYSRESLCRNIGFDGSGTNCNVDSCYDVRLAQKKEFMLPEKIEFNKRAVRAFVEFNKSRIKYFDRVVYFIKRWLFILFK